jgi:hypothetical protein
MTCNKWLRPFGSAAVACAMFFLFVVCFANGIAAQSTGAAIAATSRSSAPTSTFLVAPSFPLGFTPSGVATGDLRRSGRLDLIAADYRSGRIAVFLGTGNGDFASAVAYDAGPHPSAIVVADIAGNGKPGVLVADESEGTLSVLLGNGDGTLQPRQTYAVGFNPSFIAAGDFSGNGKVDVAIAGRSGNLLAILLNDGSGNFKAPILSALGKVPTGLTSADFNNDGHADLAPGNADGTISVLLGKGAGLFRPLPNTSMVSGSLSSIASGDFNKDGKIDLVVTQPGQKLVSVLLGNGDGTFASPVSYPVGSSPVFTVVADVDGDGVADLVAINQTGNTFSVLSGDGDGTFRSSQDFVAGNTPLAAVAGDFYGNGHVDLAIINHSSQSVSIPAGNGDGTFKAARSFSAGQKPVSIASGNFNKIPGLVVANYCGSDPSCSTVGSVGVFLVDDKGVYRLSSTYQVGAGPVSVALADVNGDKNLDIIALNRLDRTVSVLFGVGDGIFAQPITMPLSSAPIAVAVGDFNKDGKPDLAVIGDCGSGSCSQVGSLEILLGTGDGSFQATSAYPLGYSPTSVAVGDINGDKNLDIIIANRCGKDLSCQSTGTGTVLVGDGTGKFTPATDLALGNSPSSIALASLSSLGALDLVIARSTDNTVAVMLGNGDGSFQPSVPYKVGTAPGSLVVADFNGDGIADVAVTNLSDSTVSVLFGNGDGTLQPATPMPVGNGPASLTAIGSTTGARASLATANGNSAASSIGTDITLLANIRPMGVTANTTTLTASPATTSVNPSYSVTLSVTVAGGSGTPTGTVNITGNGTPASVCVGLVLDGTGAASCTTSALQANTTTLTATYSGDGTYAVSTGTASITVNALSPSINPPVPSPASPQPVNTPVTFTAALGRFDVNFNPTAPGGTVAFRVDGTLITGCTAVPVNAAQQATCTTASLPASVNFSSSTTAIYSGDSNFNTATSADGQYTITKASPTISLTPEPSPASPQPVNTPVTFTATLGGAVFTPIAPGGTVAFFANGAPVTGCTTVAVNASQQSICATSSLPAGVNSITAIYSGDSNFSTASSSALSYTITALNPAISISALPASPSPLNTNLTFTASLTGSILTPVVPSGTMTFALNGTTVPGCTKAVTSAGVATCAIQNMPAGSNTVTSTYSGDPNYVASAPGSAPYTITALHPTVSLIPAPASPSALNTNVTFTATLTGTSLAPVVPTGTMTFALNGTTVSSCTKTVTSAGVATCAIQIMPAGSNTVTATYSGDTNYTVAAAGSAPYTTTALAATLTLTPSPASSVAVGTSVTFTATLSGVPLAPVAPSGTVTFTINGSSNADCPAKTVTSQSATCTTASLLVPADTITATYSGDTNFTVAAPATMTETVTKTAAQTALTSSLPSASVNQQVTFTATVTAPSGTVRPTGSVTFTQGATTLCSAVTINGATGIATCSYAFTSVSAGVAITATYSGDSNFTAGAGGTFSQVVVASGSTTTLSSLPNSSSVNQQVSFTAIVTPTFTGTAVPQGTVVFFDTSTSTTLCIVPVASNGAAVCNYTFASAGSHSITASFTTTNSNFSSSVSSADTQTVAAGAVTVGVTSTVNPSTVNQTVTFAATVSAVNPGAAVPQGTITYSDALAGTALCTVTVASNGNVPACAVPMFLAGAHTITAAFTPSNVNFQSGTSSGLNQVVGRTATTTTVVAAPSTSSVNQPVTFTATVTPAIAGFSGSTSPTGSVTFGYTLGTQTGFLCTSAIPVSTVGSVTSAACTTTLPANGTYTVSATYAGDRNFVGATPATLSQIVNAQGTTVIVTAQPNSSVVNQPVSFTAVITPGFVGSTVPTGTVTFTDTLTGTQLCSIAVSAGVVAPCTANLLPATTHTISAAYSSGDSNFTGSTSAVFSEPVQPGPTKLTLASSSPTSVAGQPVSFTAVVTPTPTGTAVPTGTIAFSSSDGTLNTSCGAVPVTASGTGAATASCMAQFPLTASGQINVSASYSSDSNFTASTGTAAPVQTVQNFAVAFSLQTKSGTATSGPVLLTQGYSTIGSSTAKDPFNPLQITVVSTSLSGFADSLNLTCMVTNTSTMTPVSDPSCSPFVTTTPGSGGSLAYILSASSSAAVGQYSVTLTATDSKTPALSHSTAPLSVYIVGVAATLTLPQGATGSVDALFNTATTASGTPPTLLNSFSCGTILNVADGSQVAGGEVACSGPSGGAAVTGVQTKVPITIILSTSTVAQMRRSTTIFAVSFFGIPFLALVGWFGGKKSQRKNFLPFIGIILLILGLSYATGCGGKSTPVGGLSAGSYLVQVVATDQNGAKYYAVVPLVVNSK